MNDIPKLETQRLVLSEFDVSDSEALYSYASNPVVARTTSWNPHGSIEESMKFIEAARSGIRAMCWAIRKKEDLIAVGSISFSRTSTSQARIDYALSEREWNKGFVTEAARSVIAWAFEQHDELVAIRSGGLSENVGSMRVMEKCGMELERRYRVRFAKFNNEEREVADYILTREQFVKRRLKS